MGRDVEIIKVVIMDKVLSLVSQRDSKAFLELDPGEGTSVFLSPHSLPSAALHRVLLLGS